MRMTSSSTVPGQKRRSTSPGFSSEDAKPLCCRFSRGCPCFSKCAREMVSFTLEMHIFGENSRPDYA